MSCPLMLSGSNIRDHWPRLITSGIVPHPLKNLTFFGEIPLKI